MLTVPCLQWIAMASLLMAIPMAEEGKDDERSEWARQVEADWDRQMALRFVSDATQPVTVESDAAGGCDGVINGQWGFHTAMEDNPWWQIDLGAPQRLSRIVVYNRADFAERAKHLRILISDEGKEFSQIYQNDGTVFVGFGDASPLVVEWPDQTTRFVRLQLPGKHYFHLDEVQIFDVHNENIALGKTATQSSVSEWSAGPIKTAPVLETVVQRGLALAKDLKTLGVDVSAEESLLQDIRSSISAGAHLSDDMAMRRAQWAVRRLALQNPLLDFPILFVKRAPSMLPHMSDQYYGWWSRPGGGIYILEGYQTESPQLRCLTEGWPEGNFLRPEISFDGQKVLFAFCRYYPTLKDMDKVDKDRLPEDAFYQIFEMHRDGSGARQLTHGRYDDFDARYLPDGHIVFLSTRKGTALRTDRHSARMSLDATQPDSFVRCGGDNRRPVSVFTLHAMNGDGGDLRAISAFENFEWTPAVLNDGRLAYARWDYIDRFNGHFMSLWSTNTDGTHAQLVYGNYTISPQAIFEARPIPNSHKLVFTAAAHHSIMGGALALLDRRVGDEGPAPLTRLTTEVPYPEAEGWPTSYYANPYPLSETYYLVAWSDRPLPPHHGGSPVLGDQNPINATGIYYYDAFGNLELLHRDPAISSMYPLPLRSRPKPPSQPNRVDWEEEAIGRYMVQDVYRGLPNRYHGQVRALRIVGVTPKIQPHMNTPVLGVSAEDTGKFILGTVPVESDGSAYFQAPSGIPVFFQALDAQGRAIQTMRSLTYIQPGQTLACIGCHEGRNTAPSLAVGRPLAMTRPPSRIRPEPHGTWPLRYDQLIQPVLDRACVACHTAPEDPSAEPKGAERLDLTPAHSYASLMKYGDEDLKKLAFERDRSNPGESPSLNSRLMDAIRDRSIHGDAPLLTPQEVRRFYVWMDTYAHRLGSFGPSQETELRQLRRELSSILIAQP